MTLTLEQFRDALGDPSRRAALGLPMTEAEVREVLADESQVAAYFEIWERDQGRREGNAHYWQPSAVAGFVLSVVGIVAGGYAFLPFAWTVTPGLVVILTIAAVLVSANGLSACAANGTRGRVLAIWGVVIGCVTVVGGIALIIHVVST
ncbi:hypothetical protein [Herbiconiux sp. UC225_62]|uniref:hypothetical protein n=1 Tax=Herbiconiux sp. UC225_62 TaxID=3350168 RepID=UPI0036D39853